jgi:hypothetical protein|tara:strand:+ start:2937 stop:3347 length:411 start_codon:yes stop_codon:yes gene_type:complete
MKIRLSLKINIILIIFVLLPYDIYAHHGWSYYREEISITSKVTKLRLRNPHDQILTIDENNKVWNLLLAPPARNRRFGFDGNVIKIGDQIVIIGQKHITKDEIKIHCIYKNQELIYIYRYPNGMSSFDFMRLDGEC